MKKIIFKMIGIVLACIAGLFGVVVGVLAIQGKFKTPVLYPQMLSFENNNSIILPVGELPEDPEEREDYFESIDWYYQPNAYQLMVDNDNNPETDEVAVDRGLYYFVLTGTNENREYPVNRPDCEIWFVDNIGKSLITLKDKDGKDLVADSQNRYRVKCNEKIYFELKNVNSNNYQGGLVKIGARSTADVPTYAGEELSLWIDREIKTIGVDYEDSTPIINPNDTTEVSQMINVGLDVAFEMKYVSNPSYSLDPISKENGKIVELYYSGYNTTFRNDYILVNSSNVASDDELKNLFYYEDDKLYFKANSAGAMVGEYYFKVAVFPTYLAKTEYDKTHEGNITNFARVQEMLVTDLTIRVEATDVVGVTIRNNLTLNLHKQEKIYINNPDAVSGSSEQSLNIDMFVDSDILDKTTLRYSEIDFNTLNSYKSTVKPKFLRVGAEDQSEAKDFDELTGAIVELTNVQFGTNTIIDYIKVEETIYKCCNGIAYKTETNNVELLVSDSYLDIYEETVDNSGKTIYQALSNELINEYFEISNKSFDKENYGKTSWTVIPKKFLDKKIYFGLLVVNGKGIGDGDLENYFKLTKLDIQEEPIGVLTTENYTNKMAIKYGETVDYESVKLEDLIEVKSGSYSHLVCLVKKDEGNSYPVAVTEFECAIGTDTYVVVGYQDNGNWVNGIKVQSVVENHPIYLAYFEYGYEMSKMTAFEALTALQDVSVDFGFVRDPDNTDYNFILDLTIVPTIVTNDLSNLFSNVTLCYQGTDEQVESTVYEDLKYTLLLTETKAGMLDGLKAYYGDNFVDYVVAKNSDNAEIFNNIELYNIQVLYGASEKGTLSIDFTAKREIDNARILLAGLENSETVELKSFKIESSTPETMVYYYGDDAQITLYKDRNAVNKTTLTITIENKTFNNSYSLDGTKLEGFTGITLNAKLGKVKSGFQDVKYKKDHAISYGILQDTTGVNPISIENNNFSVLSTGEATLTVTVKGVTFYLDIVVKASNDFKLEKAKQGAFEFSDQNIDIEKNIVKYYYGAEYNTDTAIPLTIAQGVKITDVKVVSFGTLVGVNPTRVDLEKGQILDCSDPTNPQLILSIKDLGGWKIIRESNYLYDPMTIRFSVETKTNKLENITINFVSDIVLHSVDAKQWLDYVPNVYQDTNIQLTEVATKGTAGDATFNTSAMIRVEKNDETITFELIGPDDKDATQTLKTDGTLVCSSLGKYTVRVKANNTTLPKIYTFNVVPNVVIEEKSTKEFTTNTSVTEIFTAKSYPTTGLVYGSKAITDKNTTVYTLSQYGTGIEMSSYSISAGDLEWLGEGDVTFVGGVKVADNSDLNLDVVGSIKITVNEYPIHEIKDIRITNRYVVNEKDSLELTSATEYSATDFYTSIENATDVELTGVTSTNTEIKFTQTSNTWTIDTLNDEVTADLVLTFTIGDDDVDGVNDYTYTIKGVKFTPYVPMPNNTISDLYTTNKFDVSKIFNTANQVNGIVNIIRVKSIVYAGTNEPASTYEDGGDYGEYDPNGNPGERIIYNKSLVGGGETSVAPTVDPQDPQLNTGWITEHFVFWKDFKEDSRKVTITYIIEYNSGSYEYEKTITVENRYEFTLNYSANDLTATNVTLKFTNYEDAVKYFGTDLEANASNIYKITSGKKYEAIGINKDTDVTLKLLERDILDLHRMEIVDRTKDVDLSKIEVSLVAYESIVKFDEYATNSIKIEENSIILPKANIGMHGYLVFKVTAENGYSRYYTIYIYSENNININNTQEIELEPDGNETIIELINNGNYFATNFFVPEDENVKLYLLNDVALNDVTGDTEFANIKDVLIKRVSSYTTLNLAVVYVGDGPEIYCAGMLTVHLKPGVTVTPIENNDYVKITDKSRESEGIYKATIKHSNLDDLTLAIPFTSPTGLTSATIVEDSVKWHGYESTENLGVSNEGKQINFNDEIVSINSDNQIVTSKYVDTDLLFTVKYTYDNGLTLTVEYTYSKVNVKTTIKNPNTSITVGELVDSEFDCKVALDDIIQSTTDKTNHAYTGGINDGTEEYKACDELTFTQSSTQTYETIVFTYSDLISRTDDNTFEVKFTILSHQTICTNDVEGKNDGLSISDAINTTATNTYESNVGSTIPVTVTSGSPWTVNIGGVTAYLGSDDPKVYTVEISFKDPKYLANYSPANDNIYKITSAGIKLNNKDVELDDDGQFDIEFVHMPVNKTMYMYMKIWSDTTEVAKQDMHILITQTYSGLELKYCNTGANYENIVEGSTISDLFSKLFKIDNTDVNNQFYRIKIKDPKGNIGVADFDGMGFKNPNNPNYITFTTEQDSTISVVENINQYDLSVGKVDKNEDAILYLSNEAGISIAYNYQIMNDIVVDGVDYNAGNGSYGLNGTQEYVSFVTDEKDIVVDSVSTKKNVLSKNRIGKLKDTKNGTCFTIESLSGKYTKTTINAGGSTTTTTTELPVISFARATYLDPTTNKQVNVDPLTYTATIDNYTISIIFELAKDEEGYSIYIVGEDNTAFPFENLILSLKMKGATGTLKNNDSYNDTLDIVIFNYAFSGKHESLPHTVYATQIISMSDIINGLGEDASGFTFKVKAGNTATINGKDHDTTRIISINNGANPTICFNSIGEDTNFTAQIEIYYNNYWVKTVDYKVSLKRNLQFVANVIDGSSVDLTKDQALTTNLQLTTTDRVEQYDEEQPGTKFNSTTKKWEKDIKIITPITISENDVTGVTSNGGVTYNGLRLALYKKVGDWEGATLSEKKLLLDSVKINLVSVVDNRYRTLTGDKFDDIYGLDYSNYITISGHTLTFKKDFNGTITLQLSLQASCGVYTEEWIINVSSILNIDYADEDYDSNAIKTANGGAFASGTEVSLFSSASGLDTRAVVYSQAQFNSGYIDVGNVEVSAYYKVVNVNVFSSDNFEAYYGTTDGTEAYDASGALANITVRLPQVEASIQGNAKSFYVVYKLNITVLNFTETYYFAYLVENKQEIKKLHTENIAVDDLNTTILSGNKLQLFYFAEVLTVEKVETEPTGGAAAASEPEDINKIKLVVTKEGYKIYSSTDNGVNYDSGTAFDISNLDRTENKITVGEMTYKITGQDIVHSGDTLFSYGENTIVNVTNFAEFINTINDVTLYDGENTFVYSLACENDIWYIDLGDWEEIEGVDKLFTGSQNFKMSFNDNNDHSILTTDITLTAPNVITAKKTVSMTAIFGNLGLGYNYGIIGVAKTGTTDAPAGWVTGWEGTGTDGVIHNNEDKVTGTDDDVIGTITVGSIEYKIHKITYTIGDDTDIYTNSFDFYVILCANGIIYTPNYYGSGAGDSSFVALRYTGAPSYTGDLVQKISMNEDVLARTTIEAKIDNVDITTTDMENSFKDKNYTISATDGDTTISLGINIRWIFTLTPYKSMSLSSIFGRLDGITDYNIIGVVSEADIKDSGIAKTIEGSKNWINGATQDAVIDDTELATIKVGKDTSNNDIEYTIRKITYTSSDSDVYEYYVILCDEGAIYTADFTKVDGSKNVIEVKYDKSVSGQFIKKIYMKDDKITSEQIDEIITIADPDVDLSSVEYCDKTYPLTITVGKGDITIHITIRWLKPTT